eukprot:8800185-Pyramimonas_sp.AAC.1
MSVQSVADCNATLTCIGVRRVVQNLLRDPKFAQDPTKAYQKAFVDANSQLHRHHIDDSMSGTTAIALCVRGKQISVANVGDSRATSGIWNGRKLIAMDLSTDQTPFRCAPFDSRRLNWLLIRLLLDSELPWGLCCALSAFVSGSPSRVLALNLGCDASTTRGWPQGRRARASQVVRGESAHPGPAGRA